MSSTSTTTRPYECPRCNYKALTKTEIKRHMDRKRICPAEKKNIELTDEVKESVQKNHVYQEDVNIALTLMEDYYVRRHYDDIYTVLGVASATIHDTLFQVISSFETNKEKAIYAIQSFIYGQKYDIFDRYECEIIEKLEQESDPQEKHRVLELIKDYYRFLQAFSVPFRSASDTSSTDPHRMLTETLATKYIKVYKEVKQSMTPTTIAEIQNKVVDIIIRKRFMYLTLCKTVIPDIIKENFSNRMNMNQMYV